MEERGLVGLEARTPEGEELGRITEVITDEVSGEVTHVLIERDEGESEVPISEVSLDPEADFATFRAEPSDAEPGDYTGDEVEPQGYAPSESSAEDRAHEGQFVDTPTDPAEAASPLETQDAESGQASGWEDEGSNTPESGYPRNDVYIDPDTGEETGDAFMEDDESLTGDVRDLLEDTELEVRSEKEGVVELTGFAATREDLDESVTEIMSLDGVLDVDTTDVDLG